MFMAPIAGTWSDRLGSRLLCTIGCAVIVIAQFFVGSLGLQSSLVRIMLPLALWGVGWVLFNAPNQSATLGAVTYDKIGAAAGMIATTARTGSAIGVAMAATLFSTMLSAAGLSPAQTQSPQSWSAMPESVIGSFNYTIHVMNAVTCWRCSFPRSEAAGATLATPDKLSLDWITGLNKFLALVDFLFQVM